MRKRGRSALVRLTENELERLEKKIKESGLSKEAYMRRACLDDAAIVIVDPELLKKIYGEINRLGNNINQVAHLANANKNITDVELRQVIGWQQELQITVSRELKGVRKSE